MEFAAVAVACLMIPAQADISAVDRQQKQWNDFYAAQAAKYTIVMADDSVSQLVFKPEPMLFWSNSVRGGETNGSVFVWMRDGRAEAVGTVFSFLDRSDPTQRVIAHSFHSLSRFPLRGTLAERTSWSIEVPGIKPQGIRDAPAPAGTTHLRLAQMRELARQFTAFTHHENVERELRLLPQPIYRQTKKVGDVMDGGLFAFVTDSDPELLLLIEARGDLTEWHYAPARFSDLTIKLRHGDVEIWTYERGKSPPEPKTPYLSGRVSARPARIE
jgi:hypothetical protein